VKIQIFPGQKGKGEGGRPNLEWKGGKKNSVGTHFRQKKKKEVVETALTLAVSRAEKEKKGPRIKRGGGGEKLGPPRPLMQ